jgi:hypothetical protein
MKRGDVYLAEIKEYRAEGLLVDIEGVNRPILLPAGEILGGIKQKHKQMIGWFIPVRVKSMRPFVLSNMNINHRHLEKFGLLKAKPIDKMAKMKESFVKNNVVAPKIKVEEIVEKTTNIEQKTMKKLDVKVRGFSSGFMVWWKKINDAALYTIRLFINQDEIDVITKERTTSYHSFVNMARVDRLSDYGSSTGLNYYVTVIAEDREGKIIAASDSIVAKV